MGIAIAAEHRELAAVVRQFLARHDAARAARDALDTRGTMPPFWQEMADLGWLGLHVPEDAGGSGYGLMEVAVVAEQLGRACVPGPFVANVVLAGAMAAAPAADDLGNLLRRLVDGRATAGLALWGDGAEIGPVLSSASADVLAVTVGDDLVLVHPRTAGVEVEPRASLDPTQPFATVRGSAADLPADGRLPGAAAAARHMCDVLLAAQAAGGTAACREMATAYALDRVAFGRPIGQFQAIKHRCADMLIDDELAAAAVWDAAQPGGSPSVAQAALAVSVLAYVRNAERSIQIHGGIGFTWEHDCHLHLRRAGAIAAVSAAADEACLAVAAAGPDLLTHRPAVELPPEADVVRGEVKELVEECRALPEARRHRFLVDRGLLFPHWPPPYGRGAGPVEQLVIDDELAALSVADAFGPTAWTLPIVLPTVMVHGTDTQRDRWIAPTLRGELRWCQLFSEPGAGSDLASLTTRAGRTDGGWLVTGQKVWTSHAQHADIGIALVRTDQSAPKHRGITCMVVDMMAPGVTIRPLRQITGADEFNEVFLDEVFVADDDVVGTVDDGWRVGRTTLTNERVSLGESSTGVDDTLRRLHQLLPPDSPRTLPLRQELGQHIATSLALRAVNARAAARAIAGEDPGPGGNLTKLATAEHLQRIADLSLRAAGRAGVFADGPQAATALLFLQCRMTTIAGGTSEIVRNVIGERILGLPREPT